MPPLGVGAPLKNLLPVEDVLSDFLLPSVWFLENTKTVSLDEENGFNATHGQSAIKELDISETVLRESGLTWLLRPPQPFFGA